MKAPYLVTADWYNAIYNTVCQNEFQFGKQEFHSVII